MKISRLVTTLALVFLISITAIGQDKAGFQYFKYGRQEQSLGYNFFMGADAADFQTSVKGFGSGLTDILTGRVSMDIIGYGTENLNVSLGLGYSISKFRLSQNLLLSLENGITTLTPDPDESHDYQNTFFGYGKTKLVNSSLYVPLNVNISLGDKMMLCMGGFVDYSFYTKFKSKYKVGDEKVKDLIRPSEMSEYNLNNIKYGVNASFYFTEARVGVSATYYITPFFQEGLGPEIQEMRICFAAGIGDIRKEISKEKEKALERTR